MKINKKIILSMSFIVILILSFAIAKNAHADMEEPQDGDYYFEYSESPNGKYISYLTDSNTCTFYVENKENKEVYDFTVDDELKLANAIMELRWINDKSLAVICHSNPSLQYMCIYNFPEGEVVDNHYGLCFNWASDDISSLYYIEPTPHFSEEIGPEAIVNSDEERIYATEGGESLLNLSVEPYGSKMGFFRVDSESGKIILEIVPAINESGISAFSEGNKEKSIEWETQIGDIIWKDESCIDVISETNTITVDVETGEIINE